MDTHTTHDGYRFERDADGWQAFGTDGQWTDTYATLTDALAALDPVHGPTECDDDGRGHAVIVSDDASRVLVSHADLQPRTVLAAAVWRPEDDRHPSAFGSVRDGRPFVIAATNAAARSVIVGGANAPTYRVAVGSAVTVTRDRDGWTVDDERGQARFLGPVVIVAPIPRPTAVRSGCPSCGAMLRGAEYCDACGMDADGRHYRLARRTPVRHEDGCDGIDYGSRSAGPCVICQS